MRGVALLMVILSLNSCTTDSVEVLEPNPNLTSKVVDYNYSETEIATMNLINEYRASVGLNALEKINFISSKSEEHNSYMIASKIVSHYDFAVRSQAIMTSLKAVTVGENLAYNFSTAESVVSAWLKSIDHKKNIIGNYTHFGLSIKADPFTGKCYFTNIFANIRK